MDDSPAVNIRHMHAFSLAELLVVIVITGILAAIAVPSYQRYVVKAKVAEALAVLTNYQSYTMKLYTKTGRLPSGADILFPDRTSTDNTKSLDLEYVEQVSAEKISAGNISNQQIILGAKLKITGQITNNNNTLYYQGKFKDGKLIWQCGYYNANDKSSLEKQYRPSNCNNQFD